METRANFVLIGAFTLAVIAGIFALAFWFTKAGDVTSRRNYEVRFNGSVSGLSRGGLVLFNGLHVGEVTDVDFVADDPSRVVATIQVQSRVPIKVDTKARLELQGLTGAAALALTGGSPSAAPLTGENGKPPVIVAEPSQIQNLLENVQNIAAKADAAVERIDNFLNQNSAAIQDTVQNVDKFSKALADNSDGLGSAMSGIADLGKKIGPLANRLQVLTDDADKLLGAVDADKVRHAVDNVSGFTEGLADSRDQVKSLLADSASAAHKLNDLSSRIDGALADIDGVVKAVDPHKIASLVDGAGALGDTLKENRGNIDRMVKDASELVAKLDDSADKIDGVMTTVQSFLGSPDVKGPLGNIGEAAKSVKTFADDLDIRAKEISIGIQKFTNSGLREYEGLAIDGRRTVNDLDRLLRSLQKDPSQVIFGAKPSLPEVNGGR